MTQDEREELIFDIANEQLKLTSKAGVWAFAVDRVCELLSAKTDDELLAMHSHKKEKKKKHKAKGF